MFSDSKRFIKLYMCGICTFRCVQYTYNVKSILCMQMFSVHIICIDKNVCIIYFSTCIVYANTNFYRTATKTGLNELKEKKMVT